MALQITITDAGRAEVINATNTGTAPVEITQIGLGTGQYAPSPTQTALQAETKRLTTIAGTIVDPDTIHVTIRDETADAYNVSEFGLYTASGTLFAVYSDITGPFIQKSAQSTLLLAVDVILGTLDATSLTFGDTSFANPPAAPTVLGVVKTMDGQQDTDETRVLQRGAWGLGKWLPIADADLATESGFYSLPVALGAANSPLVGQSGSLLVVKGGADQNYLTQTWTHSNDTDTHRQFTRHKKGAGAWAPWVEAWHSQNLPNAESRLQQVELSLSNAAIEGVFLKPTKSIPLFVVATGLVTSQPFSVAIGGEFITYAEGTNVSLPAMVAATDYKIYAINDGTIQAVAWDDPAPANSKWVGGFPTAYSNGAVVSNGLWDLGWRPSCNPRGMTLSPDQKLWVDIYMMDVDYGINGYSRPDVTIADGTSLPKIPAIYGGNGTTTYAGMTWFNSWDLAIAASKRLPFYGEFTGFAYGVIEQQSVGTDPITTKHQAGHRSACGVEQATGAMWQWGANIQANTGGGWTGITEGRGSVWHLGISAVRLGASWADSSNAGSRASNWGGAPDGSSASYCARGVCDHQIL